LVRQAEAIERTLLRLSLPVRVNGGEVAGEWVRYHIVPVRGTEPEEIRLAAPAVAEQIGVAEVRIAPAGRALALDVPLARPLGPLAIALMQALGPLGTWTALAGMDEGGAPLLIQLGGLTTDSVVVLGPAGSGKSELIRTLALSLALTTPASSLQVLGIDIGGRELAVLESLPHLGDDLATSPRQAQALLDRLASAAVQPADTGPQTLLVIDDDRWLAQVRGGAAQLRQLLAAGPSAGIHVLAGSRESGPSWLVRRAGVIVAQALHTIQASGAAAPGRFALRLQREVAHVRAAYFSAVDLEEVRRLALRGLAPDQGTGWGWAA
jgi:hypothetical protein